MKKTHKYPEYSGTKSFKVTHPRHRVGVTVYAPDRASAIVQAASVWGERWQALDFYDRCTVTPTKEGKS